MPNKIQPQNQENQKRLVQIKSIHIQGNPQYQLPATQ